MRDVIDISRAIEVAFTSGEKHDEVKEILTEWEEEIESSAYERGYQNGYAMCQNNHGWDTVEANL